MNAFFDTLLFLFIVILVGGLLYGLPRLTRPDVYFAVTVPPAFRDAPEGREILARYRLQTVLSSLLALGLVIGAGFAGSSGLLLAAVLLQFAGCVGAYLSGRRQVMPHAIEPRQVREASLAPRAAALPGGWPLQTGPFVLLAAAALYLNHRWADIPLRFPVHWTEFHGPADAWAGRTPAGVYGPLLNGAVLCLMLAGLAYGLLRWSRPIRLSGRSGQAEDSFRRTVAGVMAAAEYFVAIAFVWVGLSPLMAATEGPPGVWAILGMELVLVIVTVVVFVRKGQGGTRAAAATLVGETELVGDRTLDGNWKAGIFYVNPDDPALFIEKRFGVGYTINFGRPVAWVILAAVLLIPLAAIVLAALGGK